MRAVGRFGGAATSLLVVLAAGCVASYGVRRDATLEPSMRPYEPDIPLPRGFRLAEESCEDWSAGPIRYLRHRYRGQADRAAIRRFYRDQMPLVRWTAVADGKVHGRCTMRFERGSESCTITIEEVALGLPGRVRVEVLITPRPPQPATP